MRWSSPRSPRRSRPETSTRSGRRGALPRGRAARASSCRRTARQREQTARRAATPPRPSPSATSDSLQLFLRDISQRPLLTATEEVELAKRIERGDQDAKNRMIEANLRLVVANAKRYRGLGPAVPRPDPGGHPRADPGGREVRPPARLQVLDLRDLVDPPGDAARGPAPLAHDPDPGPHRPGAHQGPRGGAQAHRRAWAATRRSRSSPSASASSPSALEELRSAERVPVSLETPVGDEGETELGSLLSLRRPKPARGGRGGARGGARSAGAAPSRRERAQGRSSCASASAAASR